MLGQSTKSFIASYPTTSTSHFRNEGIQVADEFEDLEIFKINYQNDFNFFPKSIIEECTPLSPTNSFAIPNIATIKIVNFKSHVETGRRTVDTILRGLWQDPYNGTSVTTNKGIVYHGLLGMVFDASFTLLIALCEKEHGGALVYVSPKVFKSQNILEKAIRKDIIPYVTDILRLPVVIRECSPFERIIPNHPIKDFDFKSFISANAETIAEVISPFGLTNLADFTGGYLTETITASQEGTAGHQVTAEPANTAVLSIDD